MKDLTIFFSLFNKTKDTTPDQRTHKGMHQPYSFGKIDLYHYFTQPYKRISKLDNIKEANFIFLINGACSSIFLVVPRYGWF